MSNAQKIKLSYSVIFDTNTLIFGNPFRTEIVKLVEEYKDHEEIELKYFIPKVVEGEFKSKLPQRIITAKAAYGNAVKEINGLMNSNLPEKLPFFSDQEILEAGKKALEKYGITVLDTPSIGLQPILKKAINHEPPFQSEGDAGFKDAVIAETIKGHAPGLSNTSTVVFICSDGNFRRYMEEISKDYKFEVYQSVEEFESKLKLRLLLSGEKEKIVNSLSKEAEQIFFRDEDKETLFYKEAWPELYRKFPTLFSNPKPKPGWYYAATPTVRISDYSDSAGWEPSNKAEYNIFKPLFIEKTNTNTLLWESVIDYSQDFEKRSSPSGIEPGFLWESAIYTLRFRVRWSVQLTKEAKLDPGTAKVIDVDQIKDTSGLALKWEDFPQAPISGPTTLSGTVTFTDLEDLKSDK